jgi:arylsulfatase A-like enzyme
MYPFRHGAHANHSWIKPDVRTLPHYFHDLGYRVVLAGKTHIGPREQFPFEYLPNSNLMPPGKHEVLWTDLNTAAVDEFLRTHDRAQPLCLIVASHSPHVYWENAGRYDPARVDLPPYLIDTPETRSVRARYYHDVEHLDAQVGQVMRSADIHGFGDALFVYTTDHGAQWPFAKWTLYDAGIRVPLIARWPGHIDAGGTTTALVSLVDLLPTLLDAADGSAPQNERDGRSFLPVLAGARWQHHAHVFATNTGDGRMNRSPMRAVCDGQYKLILNLDPERPFSTHIDAGNGPDGLEYWRSWEAATSADARAAMQRYRHRPKTELYDLHADPFERANLADQPRHRQTIDRLLRELDAWREAQGEDLAHVATPEEARIGPLSYAG